MSTKQKDAGWKQLLTVNISFKCDDYGIYLPVLSLFRHFPTKQAGPVNR